MEGARWVQTELLDAKPNADVSVYAIFFEMVDGDEGAKYDVDPLELLDDPRVTLFWDERKIAGRWFDEHVTRLGQRNGEENRIEWDAFILYGPQPEWTEDAPSYLSWGRPLIQEKDRLLRDLEGELARLQK